MDFSEQTSVKAPFLQALYIEVLNPSRVREALYLLCRTHFLVFCLPWPHLCALSIGEPTKLIQDPSKPT